MESGIVNKELTATTVDGFSKRFEECSAEKNGTLIQYVISCVLWKILDHTHNKQVFTTAIHLIELELDEKCRKKYLTVWKDILTNKKAKTNAWITMVLSVFINAYLQYLWA